MHEAVSVPLDERCGDRTGNWDNDYCYLPGRSSVVYHSHASDRVRMPEYEALRGGIELKVVVWKSPKFLRGILKRLFHV